MVRPNQGSALQLRFQRFECKYVLRESQALLLQRYLQPHLSVDPFGAQQPDQRYPISSLYLDNSALRLYHETISGQCSRYKLRVRSYSDAADAPVFFEVKRRDRAVITKLRGRVAKNRLAEVLSEGVPSDLGKSSREREALLDFMGRSDRIGARPMVLVRYDREAYFSTLNPDVRVTYDRRLRARASDRPLVRVGGSDWDLVDGRSVIVEFKFTGQCPAWLSHAARKMNLQRTSFSKYAHSIEATMGGYRRQVGC